MSATTSFIVRRDFAGGSVEAQENASGFTLEKLAHPPAAALQHAAPGLPPPTTMDEAALSELNSRVERVSTLAEDAGQRSEAYAAAVAEKRRAQAEWARAQVALDEQHAGLAQDASDELVLEVARLQLQAADAARRNAAARAAAEADREELADVHASVDELRRGLAALPKSERAAGVDVGAAKTQLDRLLQGVLFRARSRSLLLRAPFQSSLVTRAN